MGQKPVQGYAKTRHLDSRESVGGASVPGHSSTARVKSPQEAQGHEAAPRYSVCNVSVHLADTPHRLRTSGLDWTGGPTSRAAGLRRVTRPCDGTLIKSPTVVRPADRM